jgi:hypothetical protein
MGVQLQKINKVVAFQQKPWLKSFVEKNIEIRRNATSKVESEIAKLTSNSVFGKTMQNKRKQLDVQLVNNEKHLQWLIASPLFESVTIIDSNLVVVRRKKWRVHLDTPIFTGASVLELSKLLMYTYVYGFLKPNFGENARILYTGESKPDCTMFRHRNQTAAIVSLFPSLPREKSSPCLILCLFSLSPNRHRLPDG